SHLDLLSFPTRRSSDLVRLRDQPDHSLPTVIATDELVGQGLEQLGMAGLESPRGRRWILGIEPRQVPAVRRIHDTHGKEARPDRSEEHTSELQSLTNLV